MNRLTYGIVALVAAMTVLAVGVVSATAGSSKSAPVAASHSHAVTTQSGLTQSDLRSLLGRQLGEHAALAMNATNLGLIGSPAFPAAVKALDRNSVAISQSIAAVYGKAAGKAFLDGKFQWRDHIGFFVDYTVATAKKDKAGQATAVANLKRYTAEHGKLLGGATGLPPKAVSAARARTQGPAGCLLRQAVRQGSEHLPRCLRAHVHDRRSARRRDSEAEESSQVAHDVEGSGSLPDPSAIRVRARLSWSASRSSSCIEP